MTIRTKTIHGNDYQYEQKSIRVGKKVTTKHIAYLGTETTNKGFGDSVKRGEFKTPEYTQDIDNAGFITTDGRLIKSQGVSFLDKGHIKIAQSEGYKDVPEYQEKTHNLRINKTDNILYIESHSKLTKKQEMIIKDELQKGKIEVVYERVKDTKVLGFKAKSINEFESKNKEIDNKLDR